MHCTSASPSRVARPKSRQLKHRPSRSRRSRGVRGTIAHTVLPTGFRCRAPEIGGGRANQEQLARGGADVPDRVPAIPKNPAAASSDQRRQDDACHAPDRPPHASGEGRPRHVPEHPCVGGRTLLARQLGTLCRRPPERAPAGAAERAQRSSPLSWCGHQGHPLRQSAGQASAVSACEQAPGLRAAACRQ